MISKIQLQDLTKVLKTDKTTIYREYLQILFLSKLYRQATSQICFKGGTAVHLIFGSPRFSEDLDFSVNCSKPKFESIIREVFAEVANEASVEFKERKTIAGKRFLLSGKLPDESFAAFIPLRQV